MKFMLETVKSAPPVLGAPLTNQYQGVTSQATAELVWHSTGVGRVMNMNETLLTSNRTPQDCEAQILQNVAVLIEADPPRFQRVATRIAEMAKQFSLRLTGDNHPLAGFLKKKPDPDSIKNLEEGMAEYRALIESAERASL